MPSTDALQPPLSKDARVVVKSYGGWTNFCHSFGYKPWEDEDNEEARRVAESFAKEMYEWQFSRSSLSSNSQPLTLERLISESSLLFLINFVFWV